MELFMPHLGASVEKGTIRNWFKGVGDTVRAGEPLFEVETDKTSLEIEAVADGTLTEVRVAEGEEAQVGSVIGIIDAGDGKSAVPPAPVVETQKSPVAVPQPAATPIRNDRPAGTVALEPFNDVRSPERNFGPAQLRNGAKVTPLARRLAAERGVQLDSVAGSGPRGRIGARDILSSATGAGSAVLPVTQAFDSSVFANVPYREIPVDRMRSAIASRMTQAKRDIPHFYISADVNVDRLLACRADLQAAHGTRITINDFLLRALALTLQQMPEANRVWAGDRLLQFDRVDLGVAVAIEGGLVTPVVRDVAGRPLIDLAAETSAMVERARLRKLSPTELEGGVASLSNLGMFGVDTAQAIVNPPQAFIVAVGRARRIATEQPDGSVGFVSAMNISLSGDHRVMDGAIAASLLRIIADSIENPFKILR